MGVSKREFTRATEVYGRWIGSGGDGHADSPGHSPKYGSYTVLELLLNKVVVFQLVQVQ